jgi:phage tail-like protein
MHDSGLPLDNERVSRRHAQLECTETDCLITDLDSSNGTTVNGTLLIPHVPATLSDGDIINIGPYELILHVEPEVKEEEADKSDKEAAGDHKGGSDDRNGGGPEKSNGLWREEDLSPPPGLSIFGWRLLSYLPDAFHPPRFDESKEAERPSPVSFLARFLGIFETILRPIEWNVDNFDLYLNPDTTPSDFLPWLANWYTITFEPTWNETQRRTFLKEAFWIYARRGTPGALSRVLEIHAGVTPEIIEPRDEPHRFKVIIRTPPDKSIDRSSAERIINASKPAHTMYDLEISQAK